MQLMTRPPLQSDRQLVLRSPLEDVAAVLSGPAAVAGWFSVTRQPVDRDGDVVVRVAHGTTALHGRETWMADHHALAFEGGHPSVHGFVSLRSVILSAARFGTEVWVHLEVSRGRGARRRFTVLQQVVDQGLSRMRAELDRSSR